MDVINLISKDPSLPDSALPDGGIYGDPLRANANGPRIHEFLQEMHREVFEGREAELLTVGEMPGVTVADAALFTDPARRELDMVFQFEHVALDSGPSGKWDIRPLHLADLKASLGKWQEGLAASGWNSLYWDNHDQPRAVSRFGDDDPAWREVSAKALATVLHLHRGTPYIYQGEELGMTNAPFEGIEEFRDLESVNHFHAAHALGHPSDLVMAALQAKSRDNARTPMHWDDSANAGFTTGEPWIGVNPNHTEINAKAQFDDPTSVFAHYQSLITLRHENPVVALGDFTMLLPDHPSVYAFTRSLDGEVLTVVANLTSEPVTLRQEELPVPSGRLLSSTYPGAPPVGGSGGWSLRPWEASVHAD